MLSVKTTAEMTRFQKQAKAEWEAKRIDISAALLGWKIGAGTFENNVIVNPSETKKVKILAETGDRLYTIDFNGKIVENFPAKQIAAAIIAEEWSVGYEH